MASAADRVTLLQEGIDTTHPLPARLTPEAWSRPSACAQWQVQDVVAHLVGGAELYAGSIARGLRGDTSPPRGAPPGWYAQCRLGGRRGTPRERSPGGSSWVINCS